MTQRLFGESSKGGSRLFALGIYALVLPWLASLLIWAFAYKLRLLPLGKFITPGIWRLYYHQNGIDVNLVFGQVVLATLIGIGVGRGAWWGLKRLPQVHLPRWHIFVLSFFLGWGSFQGALAALAAASGIPLKLAADIIQYMVLPFSTLALEMTVFYTLVVRSDLFRASPFNKLSFTPFFALFLALSWSALALVEASYYWPGVGLTLISTISQEDYLLAVGTFIYSIAALIVFNAGMAVHRELRELRAAKPHRDAPHRETFPGAAAGRSAPHRWTLIFTVTLMACFVISLLAYPVLLHTIWNSEIYDPVTGYDPTVPSPSPPSLRHLLGTDPWGRDVFMQLLYGARSVFLLGGLTGLIAILLGWGAFLLVQELKRMQGRLISDGVLALGWALLALPLSLLLMLVGGLIKLHLLELALWLGLLGWPLALVILHDHPELFSASFRAEQLKLFAAIWFYLLAIASSIEATLSFEGLTYIRMSWGVMLEMSSISGYLIGSSVTRYWWLFWPASVAIALFGLGAYLLGWELKTQVRVVRDDPLDR